jgi:hypothetical protein
MTDGASVSFNTEIKINEIVYRCHPNYRGGGAWYDWAMIDYFPSAEDNEREKKNKSLGIRSAFRPGYYPAKLLGFFLENDSWMCLVHTCETKLDSEEDSCLTECWSLEYVKVKNGFKPQFRVVHAATVRDRVYVVEEDSGIHESIDEDDTCNVVLVKPRTLWGSYFSHR